MLIFVNSKKLQHLVIKQTQKKKIQCLTNQINSIPGIRRTLVFLGASSTQGGGAQPTAALDGAS